MINPIIPMVAVTGTPDEKKIHNFVDSLYRVGLRQFLIYPRSGCEIPYMSEEWFHTVQNFLECAEKLEMKVWLYDDFNWPSGHCGGRVVQNPDYRLKSVTIRGHNAGRIHTGNNRDDFFGLGRFPDLMSDSATDYFIELTHEAYYKRFQKYFGSTILGIFTDEPSIAYACGSDDIPFYDGMDKDYYKKTGRTLQEDIQTQNEQLQSECMDLIMARFKKCYIEKIANWCQTHKIRMTGHLLHDDSPYRSARNSGGLLSCLSAFDLPGIDEIYSDLTSGYELTLLGAIQYAAKDGAIAEMFALGPCDMPYAKKRCMLFLASCFRVDHYFAAISPIDMRASKLIPDFFNAFSELQPDFAGMELLGEDAISAAEYAQKKFNPDVFIRYPRAAYVRNILDAKSDQPLYDLVNCLTKNQVQWKFIQEDEQPEANIPVAAFSQDLNLLLDGKPTTVSEICRQFRPRFLITCKDGSLPQNLFVRRFCDGSRLVLELAGKSRELLDGEQSFLLPAFGVWKGIHQEQKERRSLSDGVFEIEYQNENVARALFVDEQTDTNIICKQPMKVSFAVRGKVHCRLDGEICEHVLEEDTLRAGMKEFYRCTKKYLLLAGGHLLQSEDDYKYLPSVFLKGYFHVHYDSEACTLELTHTRDSYRAGEKLQYYGTVVFKKEVILPAKADVIVITGTQLFTSVYLDDQFLGSAICEPYQYHIQPIDHQRKCWVKIVQTSSIGPIFGDVAYYDANKKEVSWRGTPSTRETFFGFEEVYC